MKYTIVGGQKLIGEIKISGNKNAILPCMAASLLTHETVTLKNCPKILDVKAMSEILHSLGADIETVEDQIKLQCLKIKSNTIEKDLAKRLRAALLLIGPLLARGGKINLPYPGGDIIGIRSIDVHLEAFKALGVKVSVKNSFFLLEKKDTIKRSEIFLDEASVTATENIIMFASLGEGEVKIKNCAKEPSVVDLCHLLTKMGAKIKGIGGDTVLIAGVKKLKGADFMLSDDYIEIGTYAIASVVTKGEVKLLCNNMQDIDPIRVVLEKFGINFIPENDGFLIKSKQLNSVRKVVTNLWPGFPTDLMSAVIVLATQAKGISICHDWMYESRMFFTDKLTLMGANITIADPHRVLVYGATLLKGRELETPDIRAGMALVLAALCANGKSQINRAELIERGYEDVVGKLKSLGAKIWME